MTENLTATVVMYENGPDECTIHPAEPGPAERVTTWVSAAEGSYVDLGRMR